MANTTTVSPGSLAGSALTSMLVCDDIVPGSEPSYQMCKTIYLYHPIGQRMTEAPIKVAQSIPRKVEIQDCPDEAIAAYNLQWRVDGADSIILNVGTVARIYGISSLAILIDGTRPGDPLDVTQLYDKDISFNVLDPLNTAGSLVLNQDPNSPLFQKHRDIAINGVRYHRSRTVTLMNEHPVYIAYTNSAFGFVGRSVYQRALFPLKSFVQTMVADDMVARKVGLIVAMLKMPGSIIDNVMNAMAGFKRALLKAGANDTVLSISTDEKVESLNLTNLDAPLLAVRKDILDNIAFAADMPAKLLTNDAFAKGFGEGSEDAKLVATYIDGVREWLDPLYRFMDMVIQRRAWSPRFYATIQSRYKEYKNVSYEEAFYRWQNSFHAEWQSILREPESKQVEVAEVKFKALLAATQILIPEMDPQNKATAIQWLAENLNDSRMLFTKQLNLDYKKIQAQATKLDAQEQTEQHESKRLPAPPPFSMRDSVGGDVTQLSEVIKERRISG